MRQSEEELATNAIISQIATDVQEDIRSLMEEFQVTAAIIRRMYTALGGNMQHLRLCLERDAAEFKQKYPSP